MALASGSFTVLSRNLACRLRLCLLAIAVTLPLTATGESAIEITSTDFAHLGAIPAKYTGTGSDISPPLAWSGLPPGTKSQVLIVDDPDAPDPDALTVTWVHWVLYNLSAGSNGLIEALKAVGLPPGTREGLNDWKRTGYGSLCPPIGRHRYPPHTKQLEQEENVRDDGRCKPC